MTLRPMTNDPKPSSVHTCRIRVALIPMHREADSHHSGDCFGHLTPALHMRRLVEVTKAQ